MMMAAGVGAGAAAVAHAAPASGPSKVGRAPARPGPSGNRLFAPDWTELYYTDFGAGRPLVFIHGWALASEMWDYQVAALADAGVRCIAYDRRGHGRSAVPPRGYDYDTLADDLAAVLGQLDLHDAILVGHSMASGEMVRYLSRHGARRVGGLVFLAPAATPYPVQAPDNPDGLPPAMIKAFQEQVLMADLAGWAEANRAPFFTPETSPAMQAWLVDMMLRTPLPVALACNRTSVSTDFRPELPRIGVRTLVIHGTKDVSTPLSRGRATAALIPGAKLLVYEGAPHGLFVTHKARLNADLLAFARA